MAVHRRSYQPLTTGLTPAHHRFVVLLRHAREVLWSSRIFVALFVLSFVPTLVGAAWIYIASSTLVQSLLGITGEVGLAVDAPFFHHLLVVQGALALLLTAWVGPGLIAPDLTNGALPLYLSRPFSRAEYVLGRFGTLFLLLSAITWIPTLLLYGLQLSVSADGWWRSRLHIPVAIVVGPTVALSVSVLLALALSAYVRWRIVAGGLFAAVFAVSAGIGEAVNDLLRTRWGRVINIPWAMIEINRSLFRVPAPVRHRRFTSELEGAVPVGFCWLTLLVVAAAAVLILDRRLRAREIVR